MNKIFKVVWSKTKECYVVVSEVAKNNGGKKKVLASVLAGLAMVGAGAQMGTPVQAEVKLNNSAVNIQPDGLPNNEKNSVGKNSTVVGYANTTNDQKGTVAYGGFNTATGNSSTALGSSNTATGGSATAIGSNTVASGDASVALGNLSQATNKGAIAIGTRTNYETTNTATGDGHGLTAGEYSTTVGGWSRATGKNASAFGYTAQATGDYSISVGVDTEATKNNSIAIGRMSKATNTSAVAVGVNNKAAGQDSTSVGSSNTVNGDQSSAFGRENVIDGASVAGAVAVGYKNKASGDRAIAIGEENESKEADTITMGNKNTANTGGGIAIGKGNTANSTAGGGSAGINSQIAIGRDNQAVDEDTLAVGRENKATERLAMAIGNRTEATGVGSIAIGSNGAPDGSGLVPKTISSGTFSVALGAQTKSTGTASVAVGGLASATATSATAVGHGATANEQAAVAVGKNATVNEQATTSTYTYSGTGGAVVGGVNTSTKTIHKGTGTDSATDIYNSGEEVAIGSGATVSDESNAAVVIGKGAKTEGNAHYSVVVGKGSYANASDGVVVGQDSYVKARESVAIGQGANVSNAGSVRSQAIGFGATISGANAYDALALGSSAQVTGVTGGVALGSGSSVSRTTASNENVGFNSKFVDGTKVRNRAYTADLTGNNDQWDSGSINTGAVSVGNDTQKRQIINVAAGNQDTDAVNVAQLKNVGVRVGADTNTATIGTNKVAADFLAYNGQLNIKGDNNRVTTVSENDANGKDANVNVKFDYDGLVKAKAGSSVTVNQKTEGGKTVFEIDAAAGGATSTEKVQAKADVAGSSDKNIAKVAPKAGENFGDVGATYEVNVSRNDVKDAAREAVTVNNGGTTKADGSYTADSNNPISVTPTKDDTNHNTSYAVTFDGAKAAKVIPLTYKANGAGDKTVTLEKGLDFTNGTNTTAEIGNDGVVKYNLNKDVDLTKDGSLTIGGTKLDNNTVTVSDADGISSTSMSTRQISVAGTDGSSTLAAANLVLERVDDGSTSLVDTHGITAEAGGRTVSFTTDDISAGDQIIHNVKEGVADTDAVNVKQLKENKAKLVDGKNTTVEGDGSKNSPYKVNVKGDLADISSITNGAGSGKITFEGDKVVKVDGDNPISLDGKGGYVTGLQNKDWDITNPTVVSGRAATEDQLKKVSDGFNNTIKLAGNTGDTDTQKLNKTGGLSFGVVGANNGQYIKTSASGSDVVADLSDDAKAKLNKTYTVSSGSTNVTVTPTTVGDNTDFKITVASTGTTTSSSWNLNSGVVSTTEGTHAGDTTQNIADTKTVTMQAGKNLTVKQTNDGAGNASVAYSLDKELTNLDKVVVNGKDGVAGKDGVTIVGPQGATGAPGIPGTNGIDGKVGISGKDGKDAVSIAGKDGVGHIGLTGPAGKDGKNATADITVKEGKAGVDGKDGVDGITRIVYQDKDGNEHQVATHDDGMKFAGDDGQANQDTNANVIKKHLNNVVDIVGGADKTKLTDKNIGVNNDNGKLKVQLAKDVDLTEHGSLTIGGTKLDKNSVHVLASDGTSGATMTSGQIDVNDTDGSTKLAAGMLDLENKLDNSVAGINSHGITVEDNGREIAFTTDGIHAGDQIIHNVKEGVADTDAVNVKQLKENKAKLVDGKNTTVEGDGSKNSPYKVNVKGDLADISSITNGAGSGKITFEGDKVVKVDGDNPISLDGKGGYVTGLQNKDWDITNPTVVSGRAATEDQLKKVSDGFNNTIKLAGNTGDTDTQKLNKTGGLSFGVVGANNGQYIKTSASGSDVVADLSDDAKAKLNKTYTVSSGSTNVTVTPTTVGDNTDFKITVASTGTTTSSSWNLNSGVVSTTEGTHAGDTTQNIADTKSVTMQAGKNLTVTQTNDKAGNTSVAYSLDKDISVETVTVTGQNGKDGKIGIDGKDGVDGKDGKNRVEITVEKGAKGVDGTDGHDGVNGHNGKDGMTRIVYEDKGGKQEVATLNDGLKFTGNNESTENNHKLNTLVKVQGEGTKEGTDATGAKEIQTSDGTKFESAADNIAVEADGVDKLTVKLNKNLKGLDSVTTKEIKLGDANDNISIKKDGDRITYTTNNGGTITTNKVANLADELHITPGTYEIGATNKDAAAKKDEVTLTYTDGNGVEKANTFAKIKGVANSNLSNISDDGKKVITGLGSIVEAGENVTVTSVADGTTGQTTYTVNAVTPAVYTTPDGKKLTKDKDGKFHKVGETAEYTGDIITSFENPKAAAGQTTKDGGMIVNNIGSAIKNQNPTMPAGQTATYLDKLKAAADANSNVKNAAVNVSDLHNTAEALKASELHIAPTDGGNDADKGGAASGNTNPGAATQAYKYNATTKQVELTFNDGNGKAVTGPKAVIDFSDLNIPAPTASYSFKTNADGNVDGNSTETEVASGKTVKFGAGKNLTVKQEIGTDGNHTYTYALNKDLTNLDKVVVNGKDGIDGKDGVSITGPKGESAPGAKDGQDGKVGIAGKDGKDAVSIAGKDGVGYIGLTGPAGKDGRNATADITVKDGVPGVDGQPGETMTRIVYQDKDGNEHQVATHDDGMKFAGDDGQANQDTNAQVIKKHLNNVVDIVGGADKTKLTDKNIGVNNVNGKLKVQLAKDVNLTDTGSIKFGDTADNNTVINKGGITITKPATATDPAKTVSLTGDGLNNGGNKITNVAAGTDNTDAVNVSQLKGSITTVKSSDGSITVTDANAGSTDPTKGHAYDIKINNQRVVEKAQTPVVYTDKDGHKLYKIVDPTTGNVTFNTKEDGTGTTVQPNEVIASMNNGGDSTTTPMKLNNVGSSIQKPNSTDTFLKQLDDANKSTPNGAVNVSDLKKTSDALIDKGLVFDANNKDPKTNKLGSKVTVSGTGALGASENFEDKYNTDNIRTNITQDSTGNTTIAIGLNKNLKGLESVSVPGKDGVDGQDGVSITGKDGANGLDGKVSIGKDGKDAVSISGKDGIGHIGLTGAAGKDGTNTKADITVKEGKPGLNGTDGITRIVYKDKDGNDHEVATHDDGLKFTGNNESTENKHKLNSVVKVQGEGVTENATSGKLEANGQEFKSATGNIAVVADGGSTLTVKMNKDLNLTKDGSLTVGDTRVNKDGITITNTDPNKTVSVTGSGLNNGGNTITNVAAGTNDTDAVNVSQLKGSITTVKSSDGSITVTDANAGSTDPTKGHAYDIKVNNQGVVNNAQIPVVYTKDDGTKVYKQPDGTFNTAKDGSGDVVAANKVIASMNNAANSSTDPTKLQNVGSSIADKAGNTYLDKINAAAGDNNTKYGAVNVSDLKNTADAIGNKGLNFGAQSGTDIHKNLGEKLEIVGGGTKADDKYDASNIKTMTKDGKVVIALDKDLKADSVTVGEKGAPGKDGVDGKIGVNGKDGSAVVLNGKDGSIGLNGKDGKNGISIKGQDGKVGVDGKDGETRFVYTEKLVNPDGSTKEVTHEIATMDDGMKYAGDDAQGTDKTKVISKKLNQTVDIVGGADKTKLTDNNIGVNNDGGKLKVQLSSELSGITKISNGGSSITFNSTPSDTVPAVTISGGNLDMGGNKITNVKAGEADTDAVNYKQLKDSRTTVTSQDGSVTITPTPNGDSMNYDLKVNPPLDPRVDQLAEEVGRVGAQGAALSALKPIQYDPLEPTQIMAGYGNYRGNSAIAMGVAHYKNESTLMHAGVSWAGGSRHMMANAGVTWKVGNRDSEAAVADRYRKGPISSTYAMQQEMAAMKAQNAGLKGEVSDLKAENEQMKAQIAAMMAKLGL